MGQAFGIENAKIVAGGVAQIASIVIDAAKDGFTVADVQYLMQLVMILPQLSKINQQELMKELKDLDAQEIEQIKEHIKQKFDIANDVLEANIEKILDLSAKVAGLIPEVIQIGQVLKKK